MEPKNTISSSIKNRIETFKEGYIFTYMEFENASKNKEAIIMYWKKREEILVE